VGHPGQGHAAASPHVAGDPVGEGRGSDLIVGSRDGEDRIGDPAEVRTHVVVGESLTTARVGLGVHAGERLEQAPGRLGLGGDEPRGEPALFGAGDDGGRAVLADEGRPFVPGRRGTERRAGAEDGERRERPRVSQTEFQSRRSTEGHPCVHGVGGVDRGGDLGDRVGQVGDGEAPLRRGAVPVAREIPDHDAGALPEERDDRCPQPFPARAEGGTEEHQRPVGLAQRGGRERGEHAWPF